MDIPTTDSHATRKTFLAGVEQGVGGEERLSIPHLVYTRSDMVGVIFD